MKRFIVSSKSILGLLSHAIDKDRLDTGDFSIELNGSRLMIPDIRRWIDVEGQPFNIKITYGQIRKLHALLMCIEEQPITVSVGNFEVIEISQILI